MVTKPARKVNSLNLVLIGLRLINNYLLWRQKKFFIKSVFPLISFKNRKISLKKKSEFVAACHREKFWFSVWKDRGHPRSGTINSIRLTTKRRFSKALSLHRKSLVDSYSARAKQDRNFLFKSVSLAKPTPLFLPSEIPVEDWYSYYVSEFAAINPQLEDMHERELDEFLDKLPHGDFVVSLESVIQAIRRLKNKSSCGIDRVSAIHIKHGGLVLAMHISLLMQMIFKQGVVPSSFCVGDLTPIPKKGKNEIKCLSFRPITVATSLCKLFELLFINELETKYYTPPRQFGFKRRTGCANALTAVVSVLLNADFSGESIALASHDISREFDSLIHAAMLLKASQRGQNPCIVRSLHDMYSRLSIRLKLPPDKNLPPQPHEKLIPVLKGARQGAVSSPHLFNNYVLQAQDKCPTSCILSSIDTCLVCYANNVLNLSRTLQKASDIFEKLKTEYLKLGLSFNTEKTDIVLFNWQKTPHVPSLLFGENHMNTADHINYLGVPIGLSLRHTRLLLIKHLNRRISGSYPSIVSAKFRFSRPLLASLYNATVLPHILYLAPFWKLFLKAELSKILALFFRFAKYLLRFPPWYRNSILIKKYHITNPHVAVENVIKRHNIKIVDHDWYNLLLQ